MKVSNEQFYYNILYGSCLDGRVVEWFGHRFFFSHTGVRQGLLVRRNRNKQKPSLKGSASTIRF